MARKKRHSVIKNKAVEDFFHRVIMEGKLEVANLGTFSIKSMKARRGFNPGSGVYDHFPEYNKLSFEPSPIFKQHLNKWNQKA